VTDIALADLAAALGLELVGDGAIRIRRPAHPAEAGPDDLAVAMDRRYGDALSAGRARAAILWPGADPAEHGLDAALLAPRPRYAMAGLTAHFAPPTEAAPGVHPSAVIDPSAELGRAASVGPLAVIGPGARVGAGAVVLAHASLGAQAEIGSGTVLHSGARVGARCRLGARVLVHPNAVIGADGFSFTTAEPGAVEAAKARGAVDTPSDAGHVRIHSLGAVAIGDDVEIGAGATIDRGTLRDTVVGAGTKIDNQVQVGHNVRIGRDCLICAQVGLAGSAEIGDRVVLGGKVGVADNIRIGEDSVVAGASAVGSHVPARSVMMGVPAMPRDRFRRLHMALGRLPRMMERLAAAEPGKP